MSTTTSPSSVVQIGGYAYGPGMTMQSCPGFGTSPGTTADREVFSAGATHVEESWLKS
jgi:hypothetical protein